MAKASSDKIKKQVVHFKLASAFGLSFLGARAPIGIASLSLSLCLSITDQKVLNS